MARRRFTLTSTCLFIFIFSAAAQEEQKFSVHKHLKQIQKDGYDRLSTPGSLKNKTTDVQIQVYVESLGNFRAGAMDYEIDIFFIEHWTDPRLAHNRSNFLIIHDKSEVDRVWTPDLYFANSKTAIYNSVMVPNMNFRIWPSGRVRLATRVSMKVSCHMNLFAYPIDRQVCHLKIQTVASSQDVVRVTWAKDSPVILDDEIVPTDLAVTHATAETCEAVYYNFTFSCLKATFHLHRSIEYSVLQTYIPSTFIVMISWISFWIDPTSVPGRVGLALTTLLTLSTQAVGKQMQLPPVGYAKALDVWFGICITFLFGSLIEFAVVNMYARREQQEMASIPAIKERMSSMSPMNMTPQSKIPQHIDDTVVSPEEVEISFVKARAKAYRDKALNMDRLSRIAFPVAFLIVTILYWVLYLLLQ